ncbi:reverse transcriptase domain, reverse transcriptase zinc-binding domain protein [Tanacetum coccineum]
MPFYEGELPFTYLGVPLISSRLLNKDCKILVEKAKNRIGDWKNKSLSFARTSTMKSNKFLTLHIQKASELAQIVVPTIVESSLDTWQWKDKNVTFGAISVEKVWEAIRNKGAQVDWYRIVWFSHAIPRHAFHLWLIMGNSLKTQDRVRQWDVVSDTDLNLLRCALCKAPHDSHSHLFFECPFSAKVWLYVRNLAGMDLIPPNLHDIISHLQPMQNKRTAKSIFGKLILASTAYFIWLERNNRLFKKVNKSLEDIRDIIMITVALLPRDGNKTRTRWRPDPQTRIDWGIPELNGDGDGESPNYETGDGTGMGIT